MHEINNFKILNLSLIKSLKDSLVEKVVKLIKLINVEAAIPTEA